MNEKELFEKVLDKIVERYELRVERPYNDGYIELYSGDENLGGMNYDGFSLLSNIGKLYSICMDLLC